MKITRRSIEQKNASSLGMSSALLERIYLARGVTHPDQLNYSLSVLPAPDQLKGIDAALVLLEQTFVAQKRVLIVGDFDADGATSCALSLLALRAMGLRQVDFLVPNRFEYGYGLTPEIVALAKGYHPDLIITVDNGISSIDGVRSARESGISVLITDHHLPGQQLPEADAIVNPNQQGCTFPSKNLAGVGVAFYLMTALRSHLRDAAWFEQQQIPEPNLAEFLDLVALGTVADVVALDQINRALVNQGLMRIRSGRTRPGILALIQAAGRDHARLVASDLGFVVGPRINAAGRLDDMSIGIQCLLTDSEELAREYATQLDELNRDRRVIEAGMQQQGEAIVAAMKLEESELPWGVCLYEESWHQGVVGLLAARIREKFHRPVIAFAMDEQNCDAGQKQLKGSARSIPGLHIRDVLDAIATRHPDLISRFGGHAMAAGLTLFESDIEQFGKAFDDEVRRLLSSDDLQEEILTDGELMSEELDFDTARLIREGGPWGQHFPEPLFNGTFLLLQQRIVGQKHLKMVVAPQGGSSQELDAIAFNVDIEAWPNQSIAQVNLLYRLDINQWRGRESMQLLVESIQAV